MNTVPLILIAAGMMLTPAVLAQQPEFQPDARPKQDSVKYTLLKPADKTSELVKADERNPFALNDADARSQTQKGTHEENEIRERLEKLRVVGVSPGDRGLRVMLGDMVLEAGQLVPQLLPDQSVALRVGTISSQAIELFWIEAKPSGLPPRKLTIAVDLRPYVRYQLMGQPTQRNQFEKQKDEAGKLPVARLFPEVSQVPAAAAPVPTQPTAATPRAAAASSATAKVDPQWQKAMALLEEIERKEEKKP